MKRNSVHENLDDVMSNYKDNGPSLTERRRMSQSDVQQEILMIKMRQREKEQ
jgi:hypothetical protein